jgi:hypothetical protein
MSRLTAEQRRGKAARDWLARYPRERDGRHTVEPAEPPKDKNSELALHCPACLARLRVRPGSGRTVAARRAAQRCARRAQEAGELNIDLSSPLTWSYV